MDSFLRIITTEVQPVPGPVSVKSEYDNNFKVFQDSTIALTSEVRNLLNDIVYYLEEIKTFLPVKDKVGAELQNKFFPSNASFNGSEWKLIDNDLPAWAIRMDIQNSLFTILYANAQTKDGDTDTFWTTVKTLNTGGTWS